MCESKVREDLITEMSYDNIERFVDQYFKSYTEYVNNPKTIDKLDMYFTADFKATAYMKAPETGKYPFVQENREIWRDFLLKGHTNTKEILRPLQLCIDERKGKVAVILDVKKKNRTTREESQRRAIAFYGLGLENNSLKFKSLNICVDNPQNFIETWKEGGSWSKE